MASGTDQKSSATTLMQDISQQVTCSICLDHFKVPKTLPCLHNFCRECLQETIQSSAHPKMPDPVNYPGNNCIMFSFPCPACRADVNFPVSVPHPLNIREIAVNAAANEFKTNFHIESQLDMLKKKMEQGCPEHQGETLLFFCKTCNKPICQLCLANEHIPPEHDISSVHRIAQKKRDGFKTKRDRVVKRKNELEKSLQACQRKHKDMQKVVNHCKKANQELDALYAVMGDFRREMNKVDRSLSTRVSRMISDNHTISNRIERCQKQSDELDKILKKSDQELLQHSSEEGTSVHEILPQIPHVSPNSVSTGLEEGLLRICKSMAEVKAQLRGFCRQPTPTTSSEPVSKKPQLQQPGSSSSASHQPQQQQPKTKAHTSAHYVFPPVPSSAWMAPPGFPVPPNPFTPTHTPSSTMWTSSSWQKVSLPTAFTPPPPPPGFSQPQRPRLSLPQSAASSGSSSSASISDLTPPGTSQSTSTPSTSERLQQVMGEKDVMLSSSAINDDDEDDEEEEEDYSYMEETGGYRDVWSDDNSDY
ncbi:uncharacterized protein [Amphiura filiformis]|uniref:uncharacterized protein isoform X2 n=1 Tax=Amphiura filiformis TaxID=82378 RepID=UPI003B20F119